MRECKWMDGIVHFQVHNQIISLGPVTKQKSTNGNWHTFSLIVEFQYPLISLFPAYILYYCYPMN